MSESRAFVLIALFATCLGGCGAASNGEPRPTLPSYASPINNNMGWSVRCPGRSITNPLNRNFVVFYNEDGSVKSFEQFCAENDSSTRTTR